MYFNVELIALLYFYCSAPEPPYTILQEPAEGHPDFLVAEIHLPNVVRTSDSLNCRIL